MGRSKIRDWSIGDYKDSTDLMNWQKTYYLLKE